MCVGQRQVPEQKHLLHGIRAQASPRGSQLPLPFKLRVDGGIQLTGPPSASAGAVPMKSAVFQVSLAVQVALFHNNNSLQ